MHRYCAGVSVAKFEELSLETESSSSLHALKPFLCLYCEQQAHAQEVELLKSVIESRNNGSPRLYKTYTSNY